MRRAIGRKVASFYPYTAPFHSLAPTFLSLSPSLSLSLSLSLTLSLSLSLSLDFSLHLSPFPIPSTTPYSSFSLLSKGTLWNLNPAELVGAWELVDVAGQVDLGPYIRTFFSIPPSLFFLPF
jgi:hypothetical protein